MDFISCMNFTSDRFVVTAWNAMVRGNLRPCRDSVGKHSVINECCLQGDGMGSNDTYAP